MLSKNMSINIDKLSDWNITSIWINYYYPECHHHLHFGKASKYKHDSNICDLMLKTNKVRFEWIGCCADDIYWKLLLYTMIKKRDKKTLENFYWKLPDETTCKWFDEDRTCEQIMNKIPKFFEREGFN